MANFNLVELALYASIPCGLLAISVFLVVIYRVTLHPLAKYPGPWLAKVSSFYAAYHSYAGDIHVDMMRCHELYGDIVRYGPNRLLFNTNTALKDIYGYGKNVKKSAAYHRFPTGLTYSTHNAVDKAMHQRKRKLVNQAFSSSSLKIWDEALLRQHRILFGQLIQGSSVDGKWSSPKKMSDWCLYLMSDIVSDAVFSRSFETLTSRQNRHMLDLVHKNYEWIGIIFQSPIISQLKLDKYLIPTLWAARNQLRHTFGGVLKSRLESGKAERDIYDVYYNARDPETGEGFPEFELLAEALLLFGAGPDAASVSLASSFFYIIHNKKVYERVINEVRSTFSNLEEVVPGIKLSSCQYLRACIEEAQRMNPVNGGALWREVQPGGAQIDGQTLPAWVDVGVGIYSIHHNPTYFPEPFEYNPDRWLVTAANPKEAVDLAQSAWNPYSIGPRGCVGRPVAITQLTTILARLFWQFEMRLPLDPALAAVGEGVAGAPYPRNRQGEFQAKGTFSSIVHGPMIEFQKRLVE